MSMKRLLPLLLTPVLFAAAPVKQQAKSNPSSTAFAVEISTSLQPKSTMGSVLGALTYMDRYTLALGLPSKIDAKVTYNASTSFNLEHTSIPFNLRYESPLSATSNLVANTEAVYYYIENKAVGTNDHSFGYAFELGFSQKIGSCSKLLFLSTLYRYIDPSLGTHSDEVKYYLSGSKIAFQHRF